MNVELPFCTNCGSKIVEGAVFCYNCGTKLEDMIKKENYVKEIRTERGYMPQQQERIVYTQSDSKYQKRTQNESRSKYLVGGLIGGILLITLIITPIILISVFGSMRFVYLDTQHFSIEQTGDITHVDLDIINDVGKIDIIYDNSLASVISGSMSIFGKKDADITQSRSIYMTNDTNRSIFTFDSGRAKNFFFDRDGFYYDISISINPTIIANFSLILTTGRINVNLNDATNAQLSNFYLRTTTGSIMVQSQESHNVSLTGVDLKTTTGGIDFNLHDAYNTTIRKHLELQGTTGGISLNLGNGTTLDVDTVKLTVSTGNINLIYSNLIIVEDILWDITSTTGNIAVFIVHTIILPYLIVQKWEIETTTGNINVNCEFNIEIGYKFETTTTTGKVTAPSPTVSENYITSTNKFLFELTCTTGNIVATLN